MVRYQSLILGNVDGDDYRVRFEVYRYQSLILGNVEISLKAKIKEEIVSIPNIR